MYLKYVVACSPNKAKTARARNLVFPSWIAVFQNEPPPRAEKLNPKFLVTVEDLSCDGSLLIGGKSMGGWVASIVADELGEAKRVFGLLCLWYPFHPPA